MNKETIKKINKVCWVILAFLFIVVFLWAYFGIIKPSVLSAKHSCNIINNTELNDLGYGVAGAFYDNGNCSNLSIRIVYDPVYESKEYQRVLRHELCHYNQYLENRLSDCSGQIFGCPIPRIIDEIECEIKENF